MCVSVYICRYIKKNHTNIKHITLSIRIIYGTIHIQLKAGLKIDALGCVGKCEHILYQYMPPQKTASSWILGLP